MSLSGPAEAGTETRKVPTPHWGLRVLIATLAAAAVALWIPLVEVLVPEVRYLAGRRPARRVRHRGEHRDPRRVPPAELYHHRFGRGPRGRALLVAPLVLLVARVGGGALVALARRWDPLKILFNLALYATETGLAALLFRALAPSDLSGPQTWLPTYAAMLPSQLLGTLSVLLAISFAQARPSTVDLLSIVPAVFVGGPFEVTLGLLAVDLLQRQPWRCCCWPCWPPCWPPRCAGTRHWPEDMRRSTRSTTSPGPWSPPTTVTTCSRCSCGKPAA